MAFYDENGNKRYLDLEGLAYYDEKIKNYVDTAKTSADNATAQALADAKAYTDGKIGSLDGDVATVAAAIAAEANRADAAEKANKALIDANATAISDEATRAKNVEGELSSLTTDAKGNLVAAINEVDAHADQAQSEVDALEALVGFTPEEGDDKPQTVKAYVDAKVSEINGAAGTLGGRVSNLEATHATKDDGSFKTVGEEVNEAVTALVAGAPEALDTLKEIADWISEQESSGEDGATQLVSKIEKNANAIAAETQRATFAETGLDNRLKVLEGNGKGSVAGQIKDAVEALDAELDQKLSNEQGLQLHIKEVDGKITEFSGSINTIAPSDIDVLFAKKEEAPQA